MLINHRRQAGFTLLEIMLVFLLIGMVSVAVVMTLPDNLSSDRSLDWQAQRFSTVLQFAEDEALISGKELGLVFDKNNYQFAWYDHDTRKWLPVPDELFTAKVELPESMRIEHQLLGSVWDEIDSDKQDDFINAEDRVEIDGDDNLLSLDPQVYIMASGEVTPFSLVFSIDGSDREEDVVKLSVDMSGVITFPELIEE
ncbi:type II secretion system minor pseudopilin GspH [Psychromonas ossibalaenae]|uniref:type II secretion system minor pseudopilin GspH n=1 Tax=Psychromonas ossibalaenae TaxID=444922 RepID=UPI00036959C8|nr:type II secretion system minor pseudopilin GspH [Psychromonas ossibalaenae]